MLKKLLSGTKIKLAAVASRHTSPGILYVYSENIPSVAGRPHHGRVANRGANKPFKT